MRSLRVLGLGLIVTGGVGVIGGCGGKRGGGPDANDAPPPPTAFAHFVPPAPNAGADWGAIPYPSNLYLDANGRQKLLTIPAGVGAVQSNVDSLIDGLASMNGAGVRSNVYFPLDGTPLDK